MKIMVSQLIYYVLLSCTVQQPSLNISDQAQDTAQFILSREYSSYDASVDALCKSGILELKLIGVSNKKKEEVIVEVFAFGDPETKITSFTLYPLDAPGGRFLITLKNKSGKNYDKVTISLHNANQFSTEFSLVFLKPACYEK